MENKETKIILGTHNSMSYLPCKLWVLRFFNMLFAQCQNKDIIEQYDEGARVFDIRVYRESNNDWGFAHGLIKYRTLQSIFSIINVLQHHNDFIGDGDQLYIRLILERYKSEEECEWFKSLCKNLELEFPGINFIGGNRKKDWKKLYTFKTDIPDSEVNQLVSSMAEDARWYEKFMPWAYALRMNKKNKEKYKENCINIIDFI